MLKESGVSFAYANFDDAVLASMKATEMNLLLENLYRIYGDFDYLFLDEVQNIDQWPLFVNRLLQIDAWENDLQAGCENSNTSSQLSTTDLP